VREFQQLVRFVPDTKDQQKVVTAYHNGGLSLALENFARISIPDDPESDVSTSRLLILAGDRAGAIGALERAYGTKEGWMIFVPIDPAFDSLRADSRYVRFKLSPQPVALPIQKRVHGRRAGQRIIEIDPSPRRTTE
jgi:hypothetical protein